MKDDRQGSGTRAAVALQPNEKPAGFDFRPIRDDFHKLLIAVGNKLEREWPEKYARIGSAQMELLQLVRLALVNYKTMAFVASH